jgi:TRAP-type C4-dicarboxylate transport system permease small subunit
VKCPGTNRWPVPVDFCPDSPIGGFLWRKSVKKTIEYFNAILLFVIFAILIIEIVCRGILRVPISWTDELSRSIYIVLVFLGASAALRDRSHITVDILTQLLPERVKRIFRIISFLVMIPFIVVMVWGAAENVRRYWNSVISTVGWFKVGHLYLAVALSGVLMIFYIILNLVDDIRNRTETSEE